jgi:hypothetical protein
LTTLSSELFAPKGFITLFSPSMGASGGIIVLWNSRVFTRNLLEITNSAIRINFSSNHKSDVCTLLTIYGPCGGPKRYEFI